MAFEEATESLSLLVELSLYAFLPLLLMLGVICFAKSTISSTKVHEGCERLDGKTIVITGATNGLGRALAAELCARGARVVAACRTALRHDSTAVCLREKVQSVDGEFNQRMMHVDLSSLESVRAFAQQVVESEERIDCLVNNAGVICDRDFTADGIDRMMGVNYVAHFLLTNLLADKIASTPGGLCRVISVTGGSFIKGTLEDLRDLENKRKTTYDFRSVYWSSKLGLYLMNRGLARRFSEFDICSLCVDPGLMNTNFYQNLPVPQNKLWSLAAMCVFREVNDGVQSVLHAILAKDLQACSGMVIKDCAAFEPASCGWTDVVVEDIWNRTLDVIRAKGICTKLDQIEEEQLNDTQADLTAIDCNRLVVIERQKRRDSHESDDHSPLTAAPRPATPPRSNKTQYDEGDELVETVEFQPEEPAEVISLASTRQSSLEKQASLMQVSGRQGSNNRSTRVMLSRQKSDVEMLEEILRDAELCHSSKLSAAAAKRNARQPTSPLESLGEGPMPDIEALKALLDEEEISEGTTSSRSPSPVVVENKAEPELKFEKQSDDEPVSLLSQPSRGSDTGMTPAADKSTRSEGNDSGNDQNVISAEVDFACSAELPSQSYDPLESVVKDYSSTGFVPTFNFSRRNSQMHASLTDVKVV